MRKQDKIKYTAYFLATQIFIGSYITGLKYLLDIFNDKSNKNNISSETIATENYTEINNDNKEATIILNPTIPTIQTITTNPTIEPTNNTQNSEDNNKKIYNKGIITNNTNLLAKPNENSLIIKNLKINDNCIKLLKCSSYDLIKTDNFIGYIKNTNVSYNDYIENNIELEIENDIVLTTTNLNFRKENNTESKIYLTFNENTELEVLGKTNDDWLLVKYNDIIGYVKKDYTISLKEKLAKQYPNLNIKNLNFIKNVYATNNLNIREKNTIESNILNTLEKYESSRVIEEKDDWYLIMTNEYEFGYINKKYTKELKDTFIIVDLSKQYLYLYNNENLYYQTEVTTGKDSTPSDKGLFKIHYKDDYCYITDTAYVDYWLNYNSSNEGIHDASWRQVYGKEDYHYNGSHGCINTPHKIMEKIYNKANVGTKVLVHK